MRIEGQGRLAWISGFAAVMLAGPVAAEDFRLASPDIKDGGTIDRTFVNKDCGGANQSPALSWSGAPAGTRSFAITVWDPDAPRAGGWWHWLVFDLPATTAGVPRNAAAAGLPADAREGPNDYGEPTYTGPCPPPGPVHHYAITVRALDVERLQAGDAAGPGALAAEFKAHSLGEAWITGTYGR